MFVYVNLRRDINCFLISNEIKDLESDVIKGGILVGENPKEKYPLEISVNESICKDGILVRRRYDKCSSRFIYISPESYKEVVEKGLTMDTYFDGIWFGKVKVWNKAKVKELDQWEAMFLGQLEFDLGIRNNSKEK